MDYTPEQQQAHDKYQDLLNRYTEAFLMLNFYKLFTPEESSEIDGTPYQYPHNFESLEDLRQQAQAQRKVCIDLGINNL